MTPRDDVEDVVRAEQQAGLAVLAEGRQADVALTIV